jgi:hypothetical protein
MMSGYHNGWGMGWGMDGLGGASALVTVLVFVGIIVLVLRL